MNDAIPYRMSRIVAGTVVILVLLSLLTIGQESDDDCRRCHRDLLVFEVEITGPEQVPVGESFSITVSLINHADNGDPGDDGDDGHPYEVREIEIEASPSTANVKLADGEDAVKNMPDLAGGETDDLVFNAESLATGNATFDITVYGTAYYDHSTGNPDEGHYRYDLAFEVDVIDTGGVMLSNYSLTFREGSSGSGEVVIETGERITDVSFEPKGAIASSITVSSSEDDWDDGFAEIEAGGSRTISIQVDAEMDGMGTVEVSWIDSNGTDQSIDIAIHVVSKAESASNSIDYLRWTGRITGLVMVPLAIAVIILGGFPASARTKLKSMGKKRITLHCYISYTILALAILHMAVLLAGPYAHVGLTIGITLGYLTLFFVAGLAVNGATMKWMIRKAGRPVWLSIHDGLSVGFILTMCIHMVRLGTEFAFFR